MASYTYESRGKRPYMYYPIHTDNSDRMYPECITVLAIDPGLTQFGIRFEQRYANGAVITLFQENARISESTDEQSTILVNMRNYLDRFRDKWPTLHFVIIEKQMKINDTASQIRDYLLMYFALHLRDLPNRPMLILASAKAKSSKLNAPNGMNKNALKAWTRKYAEYVLQQQQDKLGYDTYMAYSVSMRNELADCIAMTNAYFAYIRLFYYDFVLPS